MHPTTFELNALGQSRLQATQSYEVLRHLRRGCDRCLAALAPRLIPWMDDEPAAEARASASAPKSKTLTAAYLRAAARAARAATTRPQSTPAEEARVRRALAILDAEGPEALGRLPRRLLGSPAVEALLRQVGTLGQHDPRLRLRLAGLACDLAETCAERPRAGGELGQLRCRCAIELANAHRVAGDHRAAQEQLNRVADSLSLPGHDRLVEARWLEIQAQLIGDQWRLGAAESFLAAPRRIYRQAARLEDLARVKVIEATFRRDRGDADTAVETATESVLLLAPDRAPAVMCTALTTMCNALIDHRRWREALAVVQRHRPLLAAYSFGRNAARTTRLEAEILGYAGHTQESDRGFDHSRRKFEDLGESYEAAMAILIWATAVERRGDWEASHALVLAGTDILLRLEPPPEVHAVAARLRAANRLAGRSAFLPLEQTVGFLSHARFNPSLRLESFLACRARPGSWSA